MWGRLAALVVFVLWLAPMAHAQNGDYDYGPWEETAAQAEAALEDDTPESQLTELRSQIANFRQDFMRIRDAEAQRIQTVQSQLDALGEPPEEGDEPPETSIRRGELRDRLEQMRPPLAAAEEAFTRADVLIDEIDRVLRERQAERLLSRGPPPIFPIYWPAAIEDLGQSLRATLATPEAGWITPEERTALLSNLPAVVALLALGLLLLLRGGRWAETGVTWLRRKTRRGTGVWRLVLSLGEVFLPLGGIVAIVFAAELSGILSPRAMELLSQVPIWLGIVLYIRWLAHQTFAAHEDEATLPIDPARRREALVYFGFLSGLLILRRAREAVAELDDYPVETNAVLDFPIIVLCCLTLFRLGQIMSRARLWADESDDDDNRQDGMHFRIRMVRLLGRGVMVVAALSPLLAAAGYRAIADALVFPTIRTLVLGGTVLVVMRFIGDLYELITKRSVAESNSLIPVFAGFLLTLICLPVLALVWGARVTDLTELWAAFINGFTVGGTRISPANILTFVIVFVIGYGCTRLLQGGLRSTVLPKTKIDLGGRNAIVSGIGYIGVFAAALVAFSIAGIDLSSLALVAGALSVGIGFGLQNIVQNFVSGIILLIERPIGEGDWVQVGENMGFVKDISVRSTRIETFDHFDVIVPNGDFISGTVTNYTRGNTIGRLIVPISVAYGSDTRKVEAILLSIAREHPLVLMNPEPFIYFKGYENSALNFEIRVYLTDVLEILVVQTEMNHQIAERFAAENIEIPFPQRDLWFRNPETMAGQGAPSHRSFAGEGQEPRAMPEVARRRGSGSLGDPDI